MDEEGNKAITEILELLNSGWERDGQGCYFKAEYPNFIVPRHIAIPIQRGVGLPSESPLEVCGECVDGTSDSIVRD